MEEKILNTINKYNMIEPGDTVVCGISGGPDSICMLDILIKIRNSKKINFEIVVCHVNHLIREEATLDEEYVADFCKKNNIKYFIKRIDIKELSNNNKQGIEETGRNARYEFFNEIFKNENANKIAIAHNKNDKAETIIMNILRGTGIAGLKGIEPIRANKYIRPLIETDRNEIEKYCKMNNLNPRIDKTNFINDCNRNKVRNIVIPYIKEEFNSNIINTLERLACVITEEDEYIKKIIRNSFNNVKIHEDKNNIVLDWKKFRVIEDFMKKRIIMYSIEKVLGSMQNIEKVNIEDILKLCTNNIGNKYLMPNKNIKIYVNNGKITFTKIV